jgi:hypothetical protein
LSFIKRRTERDEQRAKTASEFQAFGESHDKGISEASDMKPPKELIIPLEARAVFRKLVVR